MFTETYQESKQKFQRLKPYKKKKWLEINERKVNPTPITYQKSKQQFQSLQAKTYKKIKLEVRN